MTRTEGTAPTVPHSTMAITADSSGKSTRTRLEPNRSIGNSSMRRSFSVRNGPPPQVVSRLIAILPRDLRDRVAFRFKANPNLIKIADSISPELPEELRPYADLVVSRLLHAAYVAGGAAA
jgi:hypothetical protein